MPGLMGVSPDGGLGSPKWGGRDPLLSYLMIRFATAAESPFFVAIMSPDRSLRSINSGGSPPPLSLSRLQT